MTIWKLCEILSYYADQADDQKRELEKNKKRRKR